MIDERVIGRWAEHLAEVTPGALAVLLKGSYARGDAGPWSDLDFDVLVDDTEITAPYLTWFDRTGERIVHISAAVDHLDTWLEDFDEPAEWAFGFAARPVTKLVWVARPSLAAELDRPWRNHPSGEPELEDCIESLGKARNAMARGDDLSARLALRDVGQLTPSLLAPLNGDRFAATKPQALKLAIELETSPPGYRDDVLALLGFDGKAHSATDLLVIGERLVSGILALMTEYIDTLDPLLAPHLGTALREGLIQAYLAQDPIPGQPASKSAEAD